MIRAWRRNNVRCRCFFKQNVQRGDCKWYLQKRPECRSVFPLLGGEGQREDERFTTFSAVGPTERRLIGTEQKVFNFQFSFFMDVGWLSYNQ